MKSEIICGALLSSVNSQRGFPSIEQSDGPDERRYSQLTDMMNFFNPQFDESNYWTYGCNCLFLGE